MKPTFKSCFGFLMAMAVAGAVSAQPTFDLTLTNLELVGGSAGQTVSGSLTASITSGGDLEVPPDDARAGAQGWSISVRADAGLTITAITTEDTASADLFMGGFEATQLGAADGHTGDCEGAAEGSTAVSAMVLSFTMPIVTPADDTASIAVITVEGSTPEIVCNEGAEELGVNFVDGCRGAGQPVSNAATHNGATINPTTSGATVSLCLNPDCGPAELNVAARLSGDETEGDADALAALLEGINDPASGEVHTRLGEEATATVYGHILSQGIERDVGAGPEPSGVQGWSLSVRVTDAEVTDVTTTGTVGLAKQAGGFEQTQAVDPDVEPTSGPLAGLGPQGQGGVTAVVLSFTMPITLEPTGSAAVLAVSITDGIQAEEDGSASVAWIDGLKGAGQPVGNVATVNGGTEPFCTCQAINITFIAIVELAFIRGDANDDGKTDIADAVHIVNELFRGGPAATCQDANDANDDGQADLSDASFIVSFRFLGGSAPPNAYPDCGLDSEGDTPEDGLGCDSHSSCD